ncbi:MAG: helix-turn-helix transcriptional regulator [Nitrospirae bacterium]|nr:helix-turn-helix transcriptional regulator [Nitrospirota bacterium]
MKNLKLLEHSELYVCEIVAAPDTIQTKVSFHLSVLKDAKSIKNRERKKKE